MITLQDPQTLPGYYREIVLLLEEKGFTIFFNRSKRNVPYLRIKREGCFSNVQYFRSTKTFRLFVDGVKAFDWCWAAPCSNLTTEKETKCYRSMKLFADEVSNFFMTKEQKSL